MIKVATRLFVVGVAVICLGDAVFGANESDPRFVWPKNSQFNCSGILTREQDIYQLRPDQNMLTWCDADIGDKDKTRVLDNCNVGDRCEIRGTIRGHGTFGWTEITSVKADLALNVNGTWKPLSADDRLMTIKQGKDKIIIQARDLSCTLTNLQSQTSDPPSMTASSECYEESDTIYGKETLTVLRYGRDLILVNATVPIRRVNENEAPKVDETYTNKPAVLTVYRKVR